MPHGPSRAKQLCATVYAKEQLPWCIHECPCLQVEEATAETQKQLEAKKVQLDEAKKKVRPGM